MVAAEVLDTGGSARFDVGRVVRRTFEVVRRNLVAFGGLAVLFGALPYVVVTVLGQQIRTEAFSFTNVVIAGVGWVVTTVCSYILQAAIVYGTVKDLNGKQLRVSAALQVGVRHFLPLLGLAICMGLALMLGFVLLIVPGCMMMAAWAAAVPAVVMEDKGVSDSLSRSASLTKGHRWPVFGLLLAYLVLVVGGSMALAAGGVLVEESGTESPLQMAVMAVFTVATSLLSSVGTAALYCELRTAKEGVGVDALAAVFD